jgi:uncharacterized protein YmfQ (DUF2313 family)
MAYGESQYGILQFGAEPDTEEPIQPYTPDLMQYLPPYYRDSRVMSSLLASMAVELGVLWDALNDLLNQFFVTTATWSLELWERELGLASDPGKSYERRREIIVAKLRGAGTTTKQMIIETAAAFSGGEVDAIEYPAESRFLVRFIGVKGIPPNMAGFMEMLEGIKPAHLAYSFEYTFTWWDKVKELSWVQAGLGTWNDLRVYE